MKRFELGPLTIRVDRGEEPFKSEILREDKDFKIIKKENEEGESRYVYTVADQEVVFIEGDREDNNFHISRIKNATEDGESGKFLPLLFSVMEDDLRKQGFTHLTTKAIPRLAPILIKRYGFVSKDNKTEDEIRNIANKDKKFETVSLIKDLL
jgi:hypothetical protein